MSHPVTLLDVPGVVRAPRDATSLACLSRCAQEFEYRYVRDLTGARDEDAPHFGTILHVGRNEYFLHENVEQAVQAMREAWGSYVPAEKEYRTWPLAEAMMRAYHEQMGPPSARGITVLAGERAIISKQEPYGGIIDAVERINGENAVDDFKTTGLSPSPAFSRQYEFSPQISGYLDLAEEEYGGAFTQAWVEVASIPRAAKPDWSKVFRRFGPIYYSADVRAQLRALRTRALERASAIARGLKAPSMNPNACFRYNKLCTFFDACKADVDIRDGIVASRLAAGEWVEKAWDFTKRGEA